MALKGGPKTDGPKTDGPKTDGPKTDGPKHASKTAQIAALAALTFGLAACTHTVKIEAPKDPIRIDLNVKIEQEVVVRLEREVQELIKQNPNIF
jgi:hypothetical protein